MSLKAIPVLLSAALLSGCVTVPREAGFPDVSAKVNERIEGQTVHWYQGGKEDEAVSQQLRSLIQKDLTADSAVQIALLNNRSLQATYESLSIAQADLVEAGLLKNPVFEADIRFHEGGGGTSMELSLVQNFIDILYIPLRKKVAAAAFEAEKTKVTGAVLDLAFDVRRAFYTYQSALQTLEMRRHVVTATEASYEIATRLREAGNTSELDLANERALYEQSKLDLRRAELEVSKGKEALNALMGLWGKDTAWVASTKLPALPGDEVPLVGLERKAIEKSLELAVARYEVERAGRAIGLARPFGIFTDAELGATAERESDGEWGVGPAFSLPIPLFNQGQPALASAQAEYRRARESYVAEAVALRSRVRAAHATLTAARDRAVYFDKVLLPLRDKIVTETQLQYNAMQVGAFQLLQAKKEQIESGAEYVEALRDYWLGHSDLQQLLAGTMSEGARPSTSLQVSNQTASNGGAHTR